MLKLSNYFLALVITLVSIMSCFGSEKYPGFTIFSQPLYIDPNLQKKCDKYFSKWQNLVENSNLEPEQGVSHIKAILSATHQLGMSYINGCNKANVEVDIPKGLSYLSFANEFEYLASRYQLGLYLLDGKHLNKDVALAKSYLLQVNNCDVSFSRKYGKSAQKIAKKQGWTYIKKGKARVAACPFSLAFYFRGPNQHYDQLAFDVEFSGRQIETQEKWEWARNAIQSTGEILKVVIPLAVIGYATYYSVKVNTPVVIPSPQLLTTSSPSQTTGCSVDSECGFGNECVKQGFNFQGICQKRRSSANGSLNSITQGTKVNQDNSCVSDYSCGVGSICVKKPYSNNGICLKHVDSNGVPVYKQPDSKSIRIKTEAECLFDTDCPIGFRCDNLLKACVK